MGKGLPHMVEARPRVLSVFPPTREEKDLVGTWSLLGVGITSTFKSRV